MVVSLVVVSRCALAFLFTRKLRRAPKKPRRREGGPYFKKDHKTNWSFSFGDNVPEGRWPLMDFWKLKASQSPRLDPLALSALKIMLYDFFHSSQ